MMLHQLSLFHVIRITHILLSLIYVSQAKTAEEQNLDVERTVHLRTHSISAPYIDQDLQNRWWDFGADAYVNTNKHIRLTRAVQSQTGWLWSRVPLHVANFVIETEFKISGDASHLYGDGLAMWVTKERAEVGPVFGFRDQFTGLGIFIDTYANTKHNYSFPRISAMLGDGSTSYPQGEDGEPHLIAGCTASIRRRTNPTKMKLTFLRNQYLKLQLLYSSRDTWTECFTINNLELPTSPYIGYTALTGDVFETHDIISVTTESVLLKDSSEDSPKKKKSRGNKSSKTKGSFITLGGFIKFVLFGAILILGFTFARTYARQNRGLYIAGMEVLNSHGGIGSFRARNRF